jgi:uncharacterized delta-60 repeat protein
MFLPKQHKQIKNIGAASPDYDVWPFSNVAIHPDGDFVFFNYLAYNQESGTASFRTQGQYSEALVKINPHTGEMDKAFQQNYLSYFSFFRIDQSTTSIIYTVEFQDDGKMIVAGNFRNVGGVTGRDRLVRFNADGTIDASFCTQASDGVKFNSTIFRVIVQPDGKIIVGGLFTNYAGTTGRNYLVRLNSDGTTDTVFCSNASDGAKFSSGNTIGVRPGSIVLDSSNNIYVGGLFSNYGGVSGRNNLVKLDSQGVVDAAFMANAVDGAKINSSVSNMTIVPGGKLFLVGFFSNYGSVVGRSRALMLYQDGTVDSTFNIAAVDNKFTSSPTFARATSNGIVICEGRYTVIPSPTNFIISGSYKLNLDGTIDREYCKNISSQINNYPGISASASISFSDVFYHSSSNSYYIFGSMLYNLSTRYRGAFKLSLTGVIDRSFYIRPDFVNDSSNLINWNTAGSNAVYNTSMVEDGDRIIAYNLTAYPYFRYDTFSLAWTRDTTYYQNAGNLHAPSSMHFINSDGSVDALPANFVNPNGAINTITKDSNGKYYIGGSFTHYGVVDNRNYLVRLNADFSVDATFCLNAVDGGKFSSQITYIKIQPDNKIIVSGFFSNYAGVSGRNMLVRLNYDGTVDETFCNAVVDGAKFNNSANDIQIIEGKIFIGGNFSNYSGNTAYDFLVVFDESTLDLDNSWMTFISSALNNNVLRIMPSKYDSLNIYVIGMFTNFKGTTGMNYVVRVQYDGFNVTTDSAYMNNAVAGSKFKNNVMTAEEYSDGSVVFGGYFQNYDTFGSNLNYVVRINYDGTQNVTFNSNITGITAFGTYDNSSAQVEKIRMLSDESIVITGSYQRYKNNLYCSGIMKFDTSGNSVPYFIEKNLKVRNNNFYYPNVSGVPSTTNTVVNSFTCCITLQDGSVVAGLLNQFYNGHTRTSYLIKFMPDGSIDETFLENAVYGTNTTNAMSSKFSGPVLSLALQTDGKILVAGNFVTYGGITGRNRLIRLNADGTLDEGFSVNANASNKFNSTVRSVCVADDGSIIVGGDFTIFGGVTNRNRLVKLNSDGTTDAAFCVNAVDGNKIGASVYSVSASSDAIYVGGDFTNYSATTGRNRFIKLNYSGVLDTTFMAAAVDGSKINSRVSAIAPINNNVLIGGAFTSYAGNVLYRNLVKVDATTGGIDATYSANLKFNTGTINSIAYNSFDNSIICVGTFYYNNVTSRIYMIRILSSGLEDQSFSQKYVDNGKLSAKVWLCGYNASSFGQPLYAFTDKANNNTCIVGAFPNYFIDIDTRIANVLIFTREGKLY